MSFKLARRRRPGATTVTEIAKRREPLPVIDLLLLNEFSGRRADYVLPEYELETYGRNWSARVKKLVREGYLQFAEPQDALDFLTIPQLKDILRANKQKLSGKKAELITRILENIPAEKYSESVPKIYLATAIGRRELEARAYFIENQKMNYGFTNSEIHALEQIHAPDVILEKLFARDILKHATSRNYLSLTTALENYRTYLKKHGRDAEALMTLLRVIYLRLSGMADANQVLDYQYLSWVFDDAVWRRELDADRTALNLSDDDLIKKFSQATDSLALPFSYFDKATAIEIILARLHGQENLFARYSSKRKTPSTKSSAYEYYSPTTAEEPTEIHVSHKAAASSGCLLPCLIFFVTVLAVVFK